MLNQFLKEEESSSSPEIIEPTDGDWATIYRFHLMAGYPDANGKYRYQLGEIDASAMYSYFIAYDSSAGWYDDGLLDKNLQINGSVISIHNDASPNAMRYEFTDPFYVAPTYSQVSWGLFGTDSGRISSKTELTDAGWTYDFNFDHHVSHPSGPTNYQFFKYVSGGSEIAYIRKTLSANTTSVIVKMKRGNPNPTIYAKVYNSANTEIASVEVTDDTTFQEYTLHFTAGTGNYISIEETGSSVVDIESVVVYPEPPTPALYSYLRIETQTKTNVTTIRNLGEIELYDSSNNLLSDNNTTHHDTSGINYTHTSVSGLSSPLNNMIRKYDNSSASSPFNIYTAYSPHSAPHGNISHLIDTLTSITQGTTDNYQKPAFWYSGGGDGIIFEFLNNQAVDKIIFKTLDDDGNNQYHSKVTKVYGWNGSSWIDLTPSNISSWDTANHASNTITGLDGGTPTLS